MSKSRWLIIAAAIALAVGSAAGCSDDSGNGNGDGGGGNGSDGTVKKQKPAPLKCNNDCKSFVISEIKVPKDATQAKDFGVDFDNNGTVDNALGSILSALAGVSKGLDIQATLSQTVNEGGTIVLFKIQATDFSNDPNAAAQAWLGEDKKCCPNAGKDATKCATEAKTTCWSGSAEFTIASSSPKDATFPGSISGGKIKFGPAELSLELPLTSAGAISLSLKQAQFTGTLSTDGKTITDGKLSGAITKSDLDNNVIPAVAKLLDSTIKGTTVSDDTKKQIKNLFDKNSDGTITKEEVAGNDLIKTFLAGDVDIDGDGKSELSLGIGFKAVGAVIK